MRKDIKTAQSHQRSLNQNQWQHARSSDHDLKINNGKNYSLFFRQDINTHTMN